MRRLILVPLLWSGMGLSCTGQVGDASTKGTSAMGPSRSPSSTTSSSGGSGGATASGAGGSGSGTTAAGGGGTSPGTNAPCEPLSGRRVRRLSTREYTNVVSDLLGAAAAATAAPMLPFEPRVAGFDNQNTALLVSAAYQEALANVAEKLSAAVDVNKLAPCASPTNSASCLDTFIRSFARPAFGRSATDDEVKHLQTVAALGTSYANSVQLVVETILQSPQTVYTSELGADAPPAGKSVKLTPQEVASQLSLTLTGARPDAALLQAADGGHLENTADYNAQITRLIGTPRGQAQLRVFVNGWLDMGQVSESPKNTDTFPTFTAGIAAAMQEEFDAFVDDKVASGKGTLASLMSATSNHVPAALAPFYGSELVSGTLSSKHRRGVLSLPGLLTYHSADQHSGPIERGLLVRRQLFCEEIPPPPASVLQLIAANPIDTTDKNRTTRQKYEQHKTEASCSSCHSQFDVIGFGLEEMDGVGRYRTTENGLPVDSSGQLNSTDINGAFDGVADLSDKLAKSKDFVTCFVQQFFRFAESRAPDDPDQCAVDNWTESFQNSGGHLQDLLATYVSDPTFAERKEDR